MTTIQKTDQSATGISINWDQFVKEHLTPSWWMTAWLLLLTFITVRLTITRLIAAPVITVIVLLVWLATVGWTIYSEVTHRHSTVTLWLRNNLYNSITNIQITLALVLLIIAGAAGFYQYGVTNASFRTIPATDFRAELVSADDDQYCFDVGHIDPDRGDNLLIDAEQTCFSAAEFVPERSRVDSLSEVELGVDDASVCFDKTPEDPENGALCFDATSNDPAFFGVTYIYSGANWGAVYANLTNLMVFRFNRGELWRVSVAVYGVIALAVASLFVYRDSFTYARIRKGLTYVWLASPFMLFILLRGVPPVPFETNSLGSIVSGIFETAFAPRDYVESLIDEGLAGEFAGRYWRVIEPISPGEPLTGTENIAGDSSLGGFSVLMGNIWLNRNLIGVIGLALIAAIRWGINRRYPPQQREGELLRIGRFFLQSLYLILGLFAALAALDVALLILGSIGGSVLTPQQAELTGQGLGTFDPLFRQLDPDVDWGGFLLTMIIAVFAIVVSFPIGLAMALGRRSSIPGIPSWLTYSLAFGFAIYGLVTSTPEMIEQARNNFELAGAYWPIAIPIIAILFQRVWNGNVVAAFSTLYIEFIRGIPLITVLFLSIILFPIFLPPNVEILNVWRVMWGFTLFTAAYLAENVRGGLQAIPNGQYEAADSLGLSTYHKYRLIILPQALRIVIPAMTNLYIGLFKDTTLVAIVGLLDILGIANTISAQPQWLGVRREAYLFIALLYYIISALMAGYSARLEKRTGLGER